MRECISKLLASGMQAREPRRSCVSRPDFIGSASLSWTAPRPSAGARKEEPCALPASKSRGFFSRWMANDGAIPARMRIARMAEQREQRACEREMKL